MIIQYSISASAWTPITSAGQSGSCWLDEDGDGASGAADVRVIHSASSVASVEATIGKRVRQSSGNDVLLFDADSASDIYYARCLSGAAILSVDAV